MDQGSGNELRSLFRAVRQPHRDDHRTDGIIDNVASIAPETAPAM